MPDIDATAAVPAFSCDVVAQRDQIAEIRQSIAGPCGFSVGILATDEPVGNELRRLADAIDLRLYYHPVDLDIAGVDPLDAAHLRKVRQMADLLGSSYVATDGAMWVKDGEFLLEAMVPMALVDSTAAHVADRIMEIQDVTQLPVAIENPPFFYLLGDRHVLEVMATIAETADCLLCFDAGHLYGHADIARAPLYPEGIEIPWERVAELHISGTQRADDGQGDSFIDDAHPWEPIEPVWDVLQGFVTNAPNVRVAVAEAEGMGPAAIAAGLNRIAGLLETRRVEAAA